MIAEPGIFLVYQLVIHSSVSKTHAPRLRSNNAIIGPRPEDHTTRPQDHL